MKLIAFTPVWGRHEILEIWVEGVRRLRKNFDITPAVMVSNRDDYWFMRLAEGQGFYPYVFSDHSSQQRMPPPVIVKGTHVVGVKSEVQITPFENLEKLGETVDFDKALRGLGEKEIELIKNL